MRTEVVEPKPFRPEVINVLMDSNAPLKGFIFPIEFEEQGARASRS